MSNSLESINLDFKKSFHSVFQKPELIQSFLTKRSNKFDVIIKKEFIRRELETDFAIVALGGYGRKELFPSSDIDLSIIQFNTKTKKIEDIKDFIGWLWTLKVKVGHSVRTFKDIEKITKSDLKEFTSYLSYRIIFCKKNKVASLENDLKKISKKWNKTKFFKAKRLEQYNRFQSFDSTEFSLEPDLKESPGCLRDFQTALWILEHCFKLKKLQDCISAKLFSKKEVSSIYQSYTHMQALRYFINLESGVNRISFENQLLLSKKSKLKASKKSSAVEKFMRTFFLHASNLSDFNEFVFQAYDDQLNILKRPYTKNYYIFKDRIGISMNVDLVQNPELILDSLIQVGKLKRINGLDFKTIKKIQESLPKIDPKYFLLPKAGAQFLEILRSSTNLSTILKKLKQLGLMRLLIPEFGLIEGQMQFDMFHVYTVDEHTFKVVRNMRQMQIGKVDPSLKIEHELINKLPKIELLYLAGIFHDLGKGKGGDHSEIGEKIVEKFCKRLNFSLHDTELLSWLVKNHLIMSSISQKTDVHDPETITNFTENVNTIEKLNYIYMLTINDIRGTNPTLWNSWKHDLLKQLFMSSRKKLNLGEAESNKSIVYERKFTSASTIKKGHAFLNQVWDQLPDAYFSKYQLKQLSNQARAVATSNGETSVFVQSRKNLIEIFIFTPNQAGLFLKTVNGFEQLSLETIDSDIHTTRDGKYAMNTFICRHKILGGNLIQRDIQNIEQKIIHAISSENFKEITKLKTKYKKVFEYPTRVYVSPTNKKNASLVTLETLDQPYLLSKIANIFLDHGISIDSARITTLGEKVEDNFTVIDEKTKSCISQNKTNQLQKKLKSL
ncbi:protein-P-II uridylyltransferase [SAR86 cluster bacterium SAR86E]|uniref:Bifunctional uridylyltransferase/uridylyl-removing enzyme n=1 Tax=SAR86 cluster bacterium SAR86E TaxID=1208365 RepID=K6GHQ7_9GAMM|nr:protein-P-II uridylyltransferase [SAR86 cluster bacterium SAR86E]